MVVAVGFETGAVKLVEYAQEEGPGDEQYKILRNESIVMNGMVVTLEFVVEKPDSQELSLVVGTSLSGAHYFRDVSANGLRRSSLLPHSDRFDMVTAIAVVPVWGRPHATPGALVIGTYGQKLMAYLPGSSGFALLWIKSLAAPVKAIQVADPLSRRGPSSFTVLSDNGVHIYSLEDGDALAQ